MLKKIFCLFAVIALGVALYCAFHKKSKLGAGKDMFSYGNTDLEDDLIYLEQYL